MSVFEVSADRISYKTEAISFSVDRSFRGILNMKGQPVHQLVEAFNDHVLHFAAREHSIYVVFAEAVEIHELLVGVEVESPFSLSIPNAPQAAAVLRQWYQSKKT